MNKPLVKTSVSLLSFTSNGKVEATILDRLVRTDEVNLTLETRHPVLMPSHPVIDRLLELLGARLSLWWPG